MAAPTGASADRLDSWKEIATYLGREVRTVQGWEKTEGLPIHRHQHARLGSVYAFKSELDQWRDARRPAPVETTTEPELGPARQVGQALSAANRLGLAGESACPTSAPAPPPRRRVLMAAAGICLVALLGAALVLRTKSPAATGGIPSSVVVLPFLDLSPQKDQEYFSDGLTEEVIDALTRIPNLRVVARTSAFAFKGKAVDIRKIGEQLNVAAVIEGSVRKDGNQLRITAQLARVSDGYHLWSHTYDRSLRDIFTVQREISQGIADQLRAGEVPHHDQPRDVEAWRLYQEGRYFFNRFEPPESDWKAIERYKQAIGRDPNFAQAYAGVADAYAYLAENFAVAPREVMPKAREAAEKALALNDSSAEAHTSLGVVKLDFDRDREGGQREFVRAMQLNPGFGYARHWYAHSLEAQGRLNEAMVEMQKALELDPLSIPIHWDIASELVYAGRYREALQQIDKAADLFPNITVFPYMRVLTQQGMGDAAGALRTVAAWRAAHPESASDPLVQSFYAIGAVLDGHPETARQTLAAFEQLRAHQYVDAFLPLPICSVLKDRRLALLWIKRAVEEHSSMVVYLPMLAPVYGFDNAMLKDGGAQ
jgi:TolB-like protein